jgi:hypothetical protein
MYLTFLGKLTVIQQAKQSPVSENPEVHYRVLDTILNHLKPRKISGSHGGEYVAERLDNGGSKHL